MDRIRLDYSEIVKRYKLTPLTIGLDISFTSSGRLEMTRDNDIKLGNDVQSALRRLIIVWQFNAPAIETLFDFVLESENKRAAYSDAIDREVVPMLSNNREEATRLFHALQMEIGIEEAAPEAYAGAVAVLMTSFLRREWNDLGKPSTWDSAGSLLGGYSFGAVLEAAANNFRHSDEWASTSPQTPQQLKSIRVLSAALGVTVPTAGAVNPSRTNVCPEVLKLISDRSFETLMDRFFEYGKALAGL